jgi:hypothetical protein
LEADPSDFEPTRHVVKDAAAQFQQSLPALSGTTLWKQCPGMAGDLLVFLRGETRRVLPHHFLQCRR